ncbi:MAG: BMC domain-containing protein [Firmicutes bacterium]|nr:BMC domain-containing protein [Bacillota bacterium]
MGNAVGLLELSQIASGYWLAHELSKHVAVDMIWAETICPGHFLMIFTGASASVEVAMEMSKNVDASGVISHGMLANIHPDVMGVLQNPRGMGRSKALGMIETLGIAPAILAADGMVKGAAVDLVDIRLAGGMAGKALVMCEGRVDAVKAALDYAVELLEPVDVVSAVTLASPHPELMSYWQ